MTSSGLELLSIDKSYGEKRALDQVSFVVPEGQIVGFVGNNGAGKSTAMRIVLGLAVSDSGEVRFRGAPLDMATRRRIGYMPEERGLYPHMRVQEQLVYMARVSGLSARAAESAARQWAGRLGLAEAERANVSDLSLGNQQRVQLAAALLHDPVLLVLDEPFSGLDPDAVSAMGDVLKEQAAAGNPVLFSSHQLDLVERVCDQVVIISRGRVVAQGPVDSLSGTDAKRYRVVGDGITPGWADSLAGVVEIGSESETSVLEVVPGREQELLALAQRRGAVREFAPVKASLVALYEDVVSPDARSIS